MAIQVTLHVYSGRPDPVWILSQNDEATLTSLLESTQSLGTAPYHGLGYRGFSLLRTDAAAEGGSLLFDNVQSDEIGGSFVAQEPDLEEFLLWTADDNIDDELSEYVRSTITSSSPRGTLDIEALASPSCPPCGGNDSPSFNPRYWNVPARQRTNNCYNYANNRATNTYAQPGRGSGSIFSSLNCNDVGKAAGRDGLRREPSYKASTAGWYTALVIWLGKDYHWYRQDENGCWSHKPGQTPARNIDDSGNAISDPKHCDRGNYRIFCSYFVTNSRVTIL